MQFSIPFITSSVMRTESVNSSPPCTTRCPTAWMSAMLWISEMPESGEAAQRMTKSSAAEISFKDAVSFCFGPSPFCTVTTASAPIRSTSPRSRRTSLSWRMRSRSVAMI